MKEQIVSKEAPAAIGAYSQAIKKGDMIFTSGQIPIDPETSEMVEKDIEKQTVQVMENLKYVLKEAGSSFDKVIKATIFLSDLNNFSKVNDIYKEYFSNIPPARACVEVSKLPKDSLVEIEVIAFE
ncbi:RidA family protein [Halanaerobium kushneri]|jgi:2-iminobutanoate/2-iminopropanoate deaminase|uniref:2-iminobutanoate/2-iminopropanoate deaminase n=1 Tax=Halanaerobium kushneri TaxID=56779 RepID=A0A1N7A6E7_9FIRM|nr:RidA family protein [Halanaerobium kushneri]SIR34593.1 2-iminobutanoate/2-iminopropanoate deaminase [Halanaerobium kushneri]